ncbi:Uncharacterised protein [Mycobacteroides abscessus subsp. abscessus]|nr:Uncharacterised protein [Mycobacteroides abscessus subsp. abscessus]
MSVARIETRLDGCPGEHYFDDEGYDVWGYDQMGSYCRTYDRAPFQASPFRTEHTGEVAQS